MFRFRVDDKFVVDATMDGGRARFINHSCGPNCMSKIITVDGRKVSFFILMLSVCLCIDIIISRPVRFLATTTRDKFHWYPYS